MAGLSKSRLLSHMQCPKRLWLQSFRPELAEADGGSEARMAAGTLVGDIARRQYPQGILVDTPDLGEALRRTAALLSSSNVPLFEATFQYDGLLVRADLLLPEEGGHRLVEVKSSTGVKDYHLTDAAIQTWALRQAGVNVRSTAIAHIDNRFVYPGGGDYAGLFAHADVSAAIAPLLEQVPAWIAAARQTLRAPDEPAIVPGDQCGDPFACPFQAYCSPAVDGYPPEDLPYGKPLAKQLRAEGYSDLRQVPLDRLSKPRHRRVHAAVQSGQAYLDDTARRQLAGLPYPRYYLDFETIAFAVPVWAGTRPYVQIPFQWSCHIEMADGRLEHRVFLAADGTDPRRAFAESLLEVLGEQGAILVYNAGFETGRMRTLTEDFPDLADRLTAAIGRVADLLSMAREAYYHPDMHGSWSIKAVLPTIAPELAYDGLTVANGGMAQDAYLEIIDPATPGPRRQELRQALLDYCERDTFAMVRIAGFFQQATRPKSPDSIT